MNVSAAPLDLVTGTAPPLAQESEEVLEGW